VTDNRPDWEQKIINDAIKERMKTERVGRPEPMLGLGPLARLALVLNIFGICVIALVLWLFLR
jgi:hypothetical protein